MEKAVPTLEEEIRRIHEEVAELAQKLEINSGEILFLLIQRELVILNRQLAAMGKVKLEGEKGKEV